MSRFLFVKHEKFHLGAFLQSFDKNIPDRAFLGFFMEKMLIFMLNFYPKNRSLFICPIFYNEVNLGHLALSKGLIGHI